MSQASYVLKEELLAQRRVTTFTNVLVTYVFLSGFVFFEPSLSEIWFILTVPFLLYRLKTNWNVLLLFLLLCIPMIVSAFVGLINNVGLNLRFVSIDMYLFLFFLISASLGNQLRKNMEVKTVVDKVMHAWTVAALVNVFVGLYCYITGINEFLGVRVFFDKFRYQGFFKDPNVLGPFLVPVSIYFLLQLIEKNKAKLVSFLVFVVTSVGVLITFSRAAWLNYVFALFLLFVILYLNKSKYRTRIFILFMLIVTLFLFFWNLTDEIYLAGTVKLQDFILQRSTLQGYDAKRFNAQRMFVDVLLSTSLIFGAGPGNYEIFAGMSTHSLFLRYIGERGFFGFFFYVLFWAYIFAKAFKTPYKTFFVPTLIGQLINSLFIDSLHWRHLWLLLVMPFFY